MSDYDDKCAFSIIQMKGEFGCLQGDVVARRSGPDIACRRRESSQRCNDLHANLKTAGLQAFELEDDLLSVPHSVWIEIQSGGLLGLQMLLDGKEKRVNNIDSLLQRAINNYGKLDDIPCQELTDSMLSYRIKRRP